MDPEDSSDEEQDEILNETELEVTEPVHLIVQETIDEAIGGILGNLRVLAPVGAFVPALWDGIIAISPLNAWGVLTINGHELGQGSKSYRRP